MRTFTPKPRAGLWVAPLLSRKKKNRVEKRHYSSLLSASLPDATILCLLLLVSLLLLSPGAVAFASLDIIISLIFLEWLVSVTSFPTTLLLFSFQLLPVVKAAGSASGRSARSPSLDIPIVIASAAAGGKIAAAFRKRKHESPEDKDNTQDTQPPPAGQLAAKRIKTKQQTPPARAPPSLPSTTVINPSLTRLPPQLSTPAVAASRTTAHRVARSSNDASTSKKRKDDEGKSGTDGGSQMKKKVATAGIQNRTKHQDHLESNNSHVAGTAYLNQRKEKYIMIDPEKTSIWINPKLSREEEVSALQARLDQVKREISKEKCLRNASARSSVTSAVDSNGEKIIAEHFRGAVSPSSPDFSGSSPYLQNASSMSSFTSYDSRQKSEGLTMPSDLVEDAQPAAASPRSNLFLTTVAKAPSFASLLHTSISKIVSTPRNPVEVATAKARTHSPSSSSGDYVGTSSSLPSPSLLGAAASKNHSRLLVAVSQPLGPAEACNLGTCACLAA